MIRAALVGLGWWGQMHIRATAGSDKLKFTRAIDIAPDRVRDFCAEHDLALSSDLGDALADPDIDAVFLATPHTLHADQIIATAGAGKHAFTEKPFALKQADGARAVAAAKAAGIQLGLGHNYRYMPAMQEIRRLIDSGALGELHHIEANLSHDGQLGIETWRRSSDEAPTGGIVHFGAHMIDLLCWFAGEMGEVYGQTASHVLPDDVGAVLVKFRSGTMGYLADLMATPATFYFNVMGDKGWAQAQGWLDDAQLTVRYIGGKPQTIALPSRPTLGQIRANDENFAAACEGKEAYLFTPEHMVHTAAVQEAIARSVKSGTPVAIA